MEEAHKVITLDICKTVEIWMTSKNRVENSIDNSSFKYRWNILSTIWCRTTCQLIYNKCTCKFKYSDFKQTRLSAKKGTFPMPFDSTTVPICKCEIAKSFNGIAQLSFWILTGGCFQNNSLEVPIWIQRTHCERTKFAENHHKYRWWTI